MNIRRLSPVYAGSSELLAVRAFVIAVAFVANCALIFAQGGLPPQYADQSPAVGNNSTAYISLDGEWVSDPDVQGVLRYRFRTSGGKLYISDDAPNSRNRGRDILVGNYSGQKTFIISTLPLSNPPNNATITIRDANTLIAYSGFILHRENARQTISGTSCDVTNPLHLSLQQAMDRMIAATDKKDVPSIACWLYVSATLGDPESQFVMGDFYRRGIYYEKNTQKTLYWLHESALNFYMPAEQALIEIYRNGEGIPPDPSAVATYSRMLQQQIAAKRFSDAMEFQSKLDAAISPIFRGIFGESPEEACGVDMFQWRRTHPHSLEDPCAGQRSK